MPELLKNVFNQTFFNVLTQASAQVIPDFDSNLFIRKIVDKEWGEKALKQRMRHITTVLHEILPENYDQAISILVKIIEELRRQKVREQALEFLIFPDYIEQYGQQNLKSSLKAIEFITQFITCEFAIRPFLHQHQEEVMKQMLKWTTHKSEHVRRLASEGCRPRLPWGMAMPSLKKDPTPILPVLENLKDDQSEYVRRSVANNLNDIAKDNPAVVIKLIKRWKGHSPQTDWIIKHGSRTLLRKADADVYKLFGLKSDHSCQVTFLKLSRKQIRLGDALQFSFQLKLLKGAACKLRIEYAMYYVKANGRQSRKLFKITENTYNCKEAYTFNRSQSFRDLTTRKHYPGKHKIAIVVNGKEMLSEEFMVKP